MSQRSPKASSITKLDGVYNAVVWTEESLNFLKGSSGFRNVADRLHKNTRVQIVLAPTTLTAESICSQFDNPATLVVLALDSMPSPRADVGLPRMCVATLEEGIGRIHTLVTKRGWSDAKIGALGAIIPKSRIGLDDAKKLLPNPSGGVEWQAVESDDETFVGPQLQHLASQVLIHYGVDPERTLWVCSVNRRTLPGLVDHGILWRRLGHPNRMRPVHVGSSKAQLPGWSAEAQDAPKTEDLFYDIGDSSFTNQLQTLQDALVAQPIRLHHNCELLRSRQIVGSLRRITDEGDINRAAALGIVRPWCDANQSASERKWFAPVSGELIDDGILFDNKSGAISFDSYEWEREVKDLPSPWTSVVEYFDETLGDRWQADRPNLARRLETPTKTVLRGDEYYVNMSNIAPLDRISLIVDQFSKWFSKLPTEELLGEWHSIHEWKLAVAVCDQVRNQVLQFNWFAQQVTKGESKADIVVLARDLTESATGLYYSTLLFDHKKALHYLQALRDKRAETVESFRNQVTTSRQATARDATQTKSFVRRWREADHPGENLLTTALALDWCSRHGLTSPVAVGISWGGIELPLVFRHLWGVAHAASTAPTALVTDYSHYRSRQREGYESEAATRLPYRSVVGGSREEPEENDHVLILDDNTLTGHTIERVQDDLLRRRCLVNAAFVTRISGWRRYGQMRMREHGVLNPDLMGTFVQGFLGETAFALTWSRKEGEYENPIGVFSLPRRRILELLHANSSVERYDREGF